ncbi:hypothetical protein GGR56DRAFT_645335 [Xylariaceae sp. FL0804]|nr:hypothetical protein GGR56DRAFT_645335 [Xylariaceae sp. FL0804]
MGSPIDHPPSAAKSAASAKRQRSSSEAMSGPATNLDPKKKRIKIEEDIEWAERWKPCPAEFLEAVLKTRESGGSQSASANDRPTVFIATMHRYGQWLYPKAKVLGVYASAFAANEHVMLHIMKGDDNISDVIREERMQRAGHDAVPWKEEGQTTWFIDERGCLMLKADYCLETFIFLVESRTVEHQAPTQIPRNPTVDDFIAPKRDSAEEWNL